MSIFGGRSSKGTTGNSGNASGGSWTLTGTANGKRSAKAIRAEWKAPRTGDLQHRASKTPRQKHR